MVSNESKSLGIIRGLKWTWAFMVDEIHWGEGGEENIEFVN